MTEKRFYCDDPSEYRSYAIADLSKSNKTKEDFLDENEEIYDIIAFDDYLWDNNCYLTGEEVVELLNMLHEENIELKQSIVDIAKEYSEQEIENEQLKSEFKDTGKKLNKVMRLLVTKEYAQMFIQLQDVLCDLADKELID